MFSLFTRKLELFVNTLFSARSGAGEVSWVYERNYMWSVFYHDG